MALRSHLYADQLRIEEEKSRTHTFRAKASRRRLYPDRLYQIDHLHTDVPKKTQRRSNEHNERLHISNILSGTFVYMYVYFRGNLKCTECTERDD